MSCHKLRIETGRYCTPPIPRAERKCRRCDVLEDEFHAIYICPSFYNTRLKFSRVLAKYRTIQTLLNPEFLDVYEISELLQKIDIQVSKYCYSRICHTDIAAAMI